MDFSLIDTVYEKYEQKWKDFFNSTITQEVYY